MLSILFYFIFFFCYLFFWIFCKLLKVMPNRNKTKKKRYIFCILLISIWSKRFERNLKILFFIVDSFSLYLVIFWDYLNCYNIFGLDIVVYLLYFNLLLDPFFFFHLSFQLSLSFSFLFFFFFFFFFWTLILPFFFDWLFVWSHVNIYYYVFCDVLNNSNNFLVWKFSCYE